MVKAEPAAEYISRSQAAQLLNVDVRTVDRFAKQGKLTPKHSAVGVGRGGTRVFFDRAEVEALKAQSIRPADK